MFLTVTSVLFAQNKPFDGGSPFVEAAGFLPRRDKQICGIKKDISDSDVQLKFKSPIIPYKYPKFL